MSSNILSWIFQIVQVSKSQIGLSYDDLLNYVYCWKWEIYMFWSTCK